MQDVNASEILMRAPFEGSLLARSSVHSPAIDGSCGCRRLVHPRFRHISTIAEYDVRLRAARAAGHAHIRQTRTRGCERVSFSERVIQLSATLSSRRGLSSLVRHSTFNELTRARPLGVSHRVRDQLKSRSRVNERREIHSPRFEEKLNSGRKTSLNRIQRT